ncbi:MAG: PqqD family protein [Gemmatimonadota bacterium]|nr:PqqD family protein [Gemmatimonadota bacterium]
MPTTLSAASRVVATPDHVATTLSGDAIILGMTDGVYYGLNPVGTRIWELVRDPTTLGEVATTIAREFDVSMEQALADLLVLAGELESRHLLNVVAAEAS